MALRTYVFWWLASFSGGPSCSLRRVRRDRPGGPWLCTSSLPRCLVTFFPRSLCFVLDLSTPSICPPLSCSASLPFRTKNVQGPWCGVGGRSQHSITCSPYHS